MTKDEILIRVIMADAEMLARVADTLENRGAVLPPSDRRLLTITTAAKELGVSRMTVWRMIDDGRLLTVETRLGRRRVPSEEITRILRPIESRERT